MQNHIILTFIRFCNSSRSYAMLCILAFRSLNASQVSLRSNLIYSSKERCSCVCSCIFSLWNRIMSWFDRSNRESVSSMASSTFIFYRMSDIFVDWHLYSGLTTRGPCAASNLTREFSVGEYVVSSWRRMAFATDPLRWYRFGLLSGWRGMG